MTQKKKVIDKTITEGKSEYTCSRCGRTFSLSSNRFYKVVYSEEYKANDGYCNICKECINELFEQWARKYKDERVAMIIVCHYLDIPFYHSLYDSIQQNNDQFKVGLYVRQINGIQYRQKSFCTTLSDGELERSAKDLEEAREVKWTKEESKNKNTAIDVVGYDPFEGYEELDRRFLFNELVKYFDDDIVDDSYKLSQIIQIVNNNNQIRRCDKIISSMNPIRDVSDIKDLNKVKTELVSSNDKIAKENEISVKNRSNKDVGRSTLSYMMRDLREKGFEDAETNYYDQLRSDNTAWAAGISFKSLKENCFFDENDFNDVMNDQYERIQNLQSDVDDLKEEKRLTLVENSYLKKKLEEYGINYVISDENDTVEDENDQVKPEVNSDE